MTDQALSEAQGFQGAASSVLQVEQGYYPLEMALPELDAKLSDFDVRLVQLDTYDVPAVILMSVVDDSAEDRFADGALRREYCDRIAKALEDFRPGKPVRVSVVLVGEEALTSRTARRRLRSERMSRKPERAVGFYWVCPSRKRFQSGYRFFSFASNAALNPCNPEANVFTRLLRRGWSEVGEAPEHDGQVKRFLAERSFSEKLLTRPTAVWGFLLVNLVVWYLTQCLGGSRDVAVLTRCGAKVNGLIELGQWWRLVTPTFLHAGYAHMFINGLACLVLGQMLERLYGSVRFVVIYVVCGAAAAVGSFLVTDGVMVGASGAIFGIIGMLVAYGFRHRRDIPARYQAMFGAGLFPLVGLNLLLGFLIPQIDNAAHIGGLIAGFVLGFVVRPRTAAQPGRVMHGLRRVVFVVVCVVVMVSAGYAVRFAMRYPTAVSVDSEFVVERQFGPVRVSVPATWTVVAHTSRRWGLLGSTCQGEVTCVETDDVQTTALQLSMRHLSQRLAPSPALLIEARDMLGPLASRGRAQVVPMVRGVRFYPRLTYVLIPDGVAELVVQPRPRHVSTWMSAPGGKVVRRMEASLVAVGQGNRVEGD